MDTADQNELPAVLTEFFRDLGDDVATLARLREWVESDGRERSDAYWRLLGHASLACLDHVPYAARWADECFRRTTDNAMREVAQRALDRYRYPPGTTPASAERVAERFVDYCVRESITVMTKLRRPDGDDYTSNLFLCRDRDGIVKIYKEEIRYDRGPLARFVDREYDVYRHAGECGALPRCFGIVDIGPDLRFLRMEYCFSRAHGARECEEESHSYLRDVASALYELHDRGIWHLDFKPEHVIATAEGVRLVDLGTARIVHAAQAVDTYLFTPEYGTPECVTFARATATSDVFQLGVVFHEMLTGKHPFAAQGAPRRTREEAILRYALPNAIVPYERERTLQEDVALLLSRMLVKDPSDRVALPDVLRFAARITGSLRTHAPRPLLPAPRTVLFPARMGIPHRGHVDYLGRLIELGHKVVISLQHAYTITGRDPIPKSWVMKMVAQSLLRAGFTADRFSFVFTPLYETREELLLHFRLMPGMDDVVAIASGNPDVADLFPEYPVIDQKALFGVEGESYAERSWGEFLRKAVRDGDRETFARYAASGVTDITTLETLRAVYGTPAIAFQRHLPLLLVRSGSGPIVSGRVFRYISSEESAVRLLARARGVSCTIVDPYAVDTVIETRGCIELLRYEGIENVGSETRIAYQLFEA